MPLHHFVSALFWEWGAEEGGRQQSKYSISYLLTATSVVQAKDENMAFAQLQLEWQLM